MMLEEHQPQRIRQHPNFSDIDIEARVGKWMRGGLIMQEADEERDFWPKADSTDYISWKEGKRERFSKSMTGKER